MQKLRITHYQTKIKYLATQETHTINVLLAPYEVIDTLLENKMHPLSSGSKIRYAILYREDSNKYITSSGDLTPYIVREANPQKTTFTDDELYTMFNTTLQNIVQKNYNVPQFIAECSDTESKTLEIENSPDEIKAVLSVLQKTAPDYLKLSNQTTQHNHNTQPPKDIVEKAQKILEFLKKQDPSIQTEAYIMSKDGDIQPLSPETQSPVTHAPTPEEPKPKEKVTGALKELMTKYTKKQLQELYQNMPREKLLENYPEDEVKELEEFIK